MERLQKQMEFIEVDRLKDIIRQTHLTNGERKENDAEHSWHLALMAVFLSEYSKEPVDVLQVIKMVLIHDLVEIDAGDTYLYDEAGNGTKAGREDLPYPPRRSGRRTVWTLERV
jgi:putative hydrolase of HD superfamily